MFLHRLLDRDARRAFAGLAYRVLQSSGGISATEARVLYVMLAELELDVSALDGNESVERMVMRIVHPRARVAALLELVRLAHADGDMRPEEQAFIRWVAASWEMSDARVSEIELWAKRHNELFLEGVGLIERAR